MPGLMGASGAMRKGRGRRRGQTDLNAQEVDAAVGILYGLDAAHNASGDGNAVASSGEADHVDVILEVREGAQLERVDGGLVVTSIPEGLLVHVQEGEIGLVGEGGHARTIGGRALRRH